MSRAQLQTTGSQQIHLKRLSDSGEYEIFKFPLSSLLISLSALNTSSTVIVAYFTSFPMLSFLYTMMFFCHPDSQSCYLGAVCLLMKSTLLSSEYEWESDSKSGTSRRNSVVKVKCDFPLFVCSLFYTFRLLPRFSLWKWILKFNERHFSASWKKNINCRKTKTHFSTFKLNVKISFSALMMSLMRSKWMLDVNQPHWKRWKALFNISSLPAFRRQIVDVCCLHLIIVVVVTYDTSPIDFTLNSLIHPSACIDDLIGIVGENVIGYWPLLVSSLRTFQFMWASPLTLKSSSVSIVWKEKKN